MTSFRILPAIDLRGGRVVRLVQGDFARETAFGDDPAAMARMFATAGARWLHVVDLDGARAGEPRQLEAVAALVEAVSDMGCAVEVAGGLRSGAAVDAALGAGAARVVLGTAAVEDPTLVAALVARHGPARLAVALDIRDGLAVGQGWSAEAPGIPAAAALAELAAAGARVFEVTAIDRDGTMGGPDLGLYRALLSEVHNDRVDVIASGGIRSVADLRAVRELGCAGAIVGRALYDGSLPIGEALAVEADEEADDQGDVTDGAGLRGA